jgi:excisionase family DNA binding protein
MSRLITVKQTAEYLAVTEKTVSRLVRKGHLPAIKVGKALRIRPSDLEAYICRNAYRCGLYGIKPLFFRPAVLQRYKETQGPMKYYLIEHAFHGLWGRRESWHHQKCGKPLKAGEFCEVPFWKVKTNQKVIVLNARHYARLPGVEQCHWQKYRISDLDNR